MMKKIMLLSALCSLSTMISGNAGGRVNFQGVVNEVYGSIIINNTENNAKIEVTYSNFLPPFQYFIPWCITKNKLIITTPKGVVSLCDLGWGKILVEGNVGLVVEATPSLFGEPTYQQVKKEKTADGKEINILNLDQARLYDIWHSGDKIYLRKI